MGCFGCFDGGLAKQERLEEERRASQEARAKAAEAAEKRNSKNNLHNQLQVELRELRCKQLQNRLHILIKVNQLLSGRWDNVLFIVCKIIMVIKNWKMSLKQLFAEMAINIVQKFVSSSSCFGLPSI
uniref:Putative small VCP/p97-interacting protein n=1 Tax=Helianthus annuus TaxID=4232 RepID=A0A251TY14_HELAN